MNAIKAATIATAKKERKAKAVKATAITKAARAVKVAATATAKKEKLATAVASEYQKISTVLERVKVKVKKRPLSAWTITNNKRLKTQRDTIQNMPIWTEVDVKALELDQQMRADLPELEQCVANNETNKYVNFVFIGMRTGLASINKKRKELEEYARIEKIDR